MAKRDSTLVNMVLTLSVITLVSGGVLGYVYNLTKEPIQIAKTAKKVEAIKRVLPVFDNDPNTDAVKIPVDDKLSVEKYPATEKGNDVGAAFKTFSKKGFGGLVWLMVGFKTDGSIHNIEVLEHQETPGLGTKMADPQFKNQFIGKNPKDFKMQVSKDGGDVDAITAATISSRAFCDAVQRAYDEFEKTEKSDSQTSATPVKPAEDTTKIEKKGDDNE